MAKSDNAVAKEMTRLKRAAGVMSNRSDFYADEDARRLIDEIPSDTRTMTARFFGDPLPERSALYAIRHKELSE